MGAARAGWLALSSFGQHAPPSTRRSIPRGGSGGGGAWCDWLRPWPLRCAERPALYPCIVAFLLKLVSSSPFSITPSIVMTCYKVECHQQRPFAEDVIRSTTSINTA